MKFGDLAPENPALPKLCKMAAAGGGTCSPRGAHTAPGCPEAWSGCLPRALLPPLPPPLAPSSLSWGGWRRARQVGWLGPAPCRTSTPGGRSEYGRWGGGWEAVGLRHGGRWAAAAPRGPRAGAFTRLACPPNTLLCLSYLNEYLEHGDKRYSK